MRCIVISKCRRGTFLLPFYNDGCHKSSLSVHGNCCYCIYRVLYYRYRILLIAMINGSVFQLESHWTMNHMSGRRLPFIIVSNFNRSLQILYNCWTLVAIQMHIFTIIAYMCLCIYLYSNSFVLISLQTNKD